MKIRFSFNPLDACLIMILVLTLLAACGCSTVKKQQQKAETFYYKNPDLLAKQAEQLFPNIIEGTTRGKIDTVRDLQVVQIESGTPQKVRVIHTHSTDTMKIESGVKVAQIKADVDKLSALVLNLTTTVNNLQNQLIAMTEDRNKWRLMFFVVAGLIVAGVLVKLYIKKI